MTVRLSKKGEGGVKGHLLRTTVLLMALFVSAAACEKTRPPRPQEEEARTVTIWNTYYVRFQIDGVWYHAVPVDSHGFLRSSPRAHLLNGPVYVRRQGEELWQCYPHGHQLPHEAQIMMSSSRAPVTVKTRDDPCR